MADKNKAESDKRIEYLAKGRPAEYDKARRKKTSEDKALADFLGAVDDSGYGRYYGKRRETAQKGGPIANKKGEFTTGTGRPGENKTASLARNLMVKREALKKKLAEKKKK